MRNGRAVALVMALVAVLALAWGYQAQQARKAAELQLGLDSARVIAQAFAGANALKVAEVRGTVRARSEDPGFIGVLDASQEITAGFTVDYFVDMAAITTADFAWNPAARRLVIEIPEVSPARPNIDEAGAVVTQKGLFISRETGIALQRKASFAMAARASQTARSPANMDNARKAAVEAVRRNALAPLAAAGIGEVTVEVRFKGQRNANDDVWDYTLPYEQVAERIEQMRKER